ncbi:MAG: cytochrome c-type biogenesis protein CcmH [Deltaproteobacteria bacterium]|nr:cytochrome c-type biogenesis protein CcmH [Deltaproteobacteria bacterium]
MAFGLCILLGSSATVFAAAQTTLAAATAGPETTGNEAPVPGQRALEGRLLAPCCYKQTLDIHDGPVPRELRAEIRRRLLAGESPEAIERSLIERYGERIIAVSADSPVRYVTAALLALIALAGVALVLGWRRWVAKAPAPGESEPADDGRDRYDEQLDAELRDLDD